MLGLRKRVRRAGKRAKKGPPRPRREDVRESLLEMLPKNSVGTEIGVWKGDFSARILEIVSPAELHLVDPWAFRPEYGEAWYGGARASSQADMDAIHQEVVERFAGDDRVTIHRSAANDAELPPLDWAYIDGDHTYEAVKADLELCMRLVKPGGLICGDDYRAADKGYWGDGVKRAVDEMVEEPQLIGRGQFLFRRGS